VRAIGITNQRETTVCFDRKTGQPFCNAIVWLDQRTSGVVAEMKERVGGSLDALRPLCGLPINTYFSAVKMKWMLKNVQVVKEEALKEESSLTFGTIDTWLIYVSASVFSQVIELDRWGKRFD